MMLVTMNESMRGSCRRERMSMDDEMSIEDETENDNANDFDSTELRSVK